MEETMDQTSESTFSFGIEPITKRAYQHSGKYRKQTKTRRRRKSGLKYRKGEENTKSFALVGFLVIPTQSVVISSRGGSL